MNKKALILILALIIVIVLGTVIVPKNIENDNIEVNDDVINMSGDIKISGDEEIKITEENSGESKKINLMERIEKIESMNTFFENEKFNLETFAKEIDYAKVNRKDEEKEIIYTKNFEFLFQGSPAEDIIPVLNVESETADKINKTIEDEMYNYYSFNFKAVLNGEILSIITYGSAEESMITEVYHINIYTGKSVTNNELLKLRNIDSKEVLDELVNITNEVFANRTEYKNQTPDFEVEDALNNTIRNLPKDIEELDIYLNENTANLILLMQGALDGYVEDYVVKIK